MKTLRQHSYATSAGIPATVPCPVTYSITSEPILIVDSDDFYLSSSKRYLSKSGFVNVYTAFNKNKARFLLENSHFKLILIDVSLDAHLRGGLDFVKDLRGNQYCSKVAISSSDPSPDLFFEALCAGADDYLVKGPNLDLGAEVTRLLKPSKRAGSSSFRPENLGEIGFFRSQGITRLEMNILIIFANGFPRHHEIARQTGRTEAYIRKVFSRIYDKLGWPKAVNNAAKLSQLITICAMYQ